MAMNQPDIAPASAGGIPSKIGGIPVGALVVGGGILIGGILLWRSRSSISASTTTPTITTPTTTEPATPTTTPTGTTPVSTYNEASILQNWAAAEKAISSEQTDAQKINNALGGNWENITTYLIGHSMSLTGSADAQKTRDFILNIPGSWNTWVMHISTLYTQAKNDLAKETGQQAYMYMGLLQIVDVLRNYNSFVQAHPQYQELTGLQIPATTGVGYPVTTSTISGASTNPASTSISNVLNR